MFKEMVDKLQVVLDCLDGELGDSDPYTEDMTDEEIMEEFPVFWAFKEIDEINNQLKIQCNKLIKQSYPFEYADMKAGECPLAVDCGDAGKCCGLNNDMNACPDGDRDICPLVEQESISIELSGYADTE